MFRDFIVILMNSLQYGDVKKHQSSVILASNVFLFIRIFNCFLSKYKYKNKMLKIIIVPQFFFMPVSQQVQNGFSPDSVCLPKGQKHF